MAINGSLTEINVETQRAKHAQANPDDMRTWNFLKPLLFDYKRNNHVTIKPLHSWFQQKYAFLDSKNNRISALSPDGKGWIEAKLEKTGVTLYKYVKYV